MKYRVLPVVALAAITFGGACDDPSEPTIPSTPAYTSMAPVPTLYALGNHTCASTTANVTWCWGKNSEGQLGLKTNTSEETTLKDVKEPPGVSFVTIGGGTYHTCGVTAGGQAYCWGDNFFGQLGTGGTTARNFPRAVYHPGVTFSTIANGGGNFTCALTTAGAAYCWGINANGQLGTGGTIQRFTPRAVYMPAGISSFSQISNGFDHTCAIANDDTAWCWGSNASYELGVGANTVDRPRPTAVRMPVGVAFEQISAGRDHTCALTGSGLAYCWGSNLYGQLGNNKTDGIPYTKPIPVRMPTGVAFTQLQAGDHHNCALETNGVVYCWGWNTSGQIGNSNQGTDAYRPVSITMPGGVYFASVTAQYLHSCAMSTTNQAYCWGVNTSGQLGIGTQFNRPFPTAVTGGSF